MEESIKDMISPTTSKLATLSGNSHQLAIPIKREEQYHADGCPRFANAIP